MFKQLKKGLSALLITATVFSSVIPAYAADNFESKGVKVTSVKDFDLGEFPVVQPKGPAPDLTSVRIEWINSQKSGGEIISPSQIRSTLDHGGTWFQTQTIETGYPALRFATFNVSNMTLTDRQGLDFNNDTFIDGWRCLWTVENINYEAGDLVVKSIPTNSSIYLTDGLNVY